MERLGAFLIELFMAVLFLKSEQQAWFVVRCILLGMQQERQPANRLVMLKTKDTAGKCCENQCGSKRASVLFGMCPSSLVTPRLLKQSLSHCHCQWLLVADGCWLEASLVVSNFPVSIVAPDR